MGGQLLSITQNLILSHLISLPNYKTSDVSFSREGDLEGVGKKTEPLPLSGERVLPGGVSLSGKAGWEGLAKAS